MHIKINPRQYLKQRLTIEINIWKLVIDLVVDIGIGKSMRI